MFMKKRTIKLIFAFLLGLSAVSCKEDTSKSEEQTAWDALLEAPTVNALEKFMDKYPDGIHYDAAREMYLDEKEEASVWEEANESQTSDMYSKYIEKYPKGLYIKKATSIYDSLLWMETKQYGDSYAYEYYIQHSKLGTHTQEARKMLEVIAQESEAERLKREAEAQAKRESVQANNTAPRSTSGSMAASNTSSAVNSTPVTVVTPAAAVSEEEDEAIYEVVGQQAEFPGDYAAWIQENLKYPSKAAEQGIQGRVQVKFIIEKDGTVRQPTCLRNSSGDKDLEKEALRIVGSMPKWHPAKQGNKVVRSYFVLPITFRLK